MYSGISNSDHFRGPSLVAVALEVTVVGRFQYMYICYLKHWPELGGRHINRTNMDYCVHATYNQVTKLN